MNALTLLLAATISLPPFGEVKVLDTVDCTKTDHDFVELPSGVSKVGKVLGRACRFIPVQDGDEASMFSYRLGKGRKLKPNGSYVVVMDYPDDVPRNYLIVNRATDSHRCFSTGRCLGDAYRPEHVDNHPEMISVPQSGKWEQWICYTSLQDWTADYRESQVSKDNPVRHRPEDGFDFVVAQYARNHDPISKGIAVSKILLCEIPDEAKCYLKVVYPPAPLPQRHLFWREEMSDTAPLQGGKDRRRCADQVDWFRHKCRQMKMLGLNTFQKDLLEFGHVQHWDPNAIRPNWAWSSDAESNSLWARTIDMVTKEFGFSILPYYEWYGNMGAEFGGKKSYGYRKPCEPLSGEKSFTHIYWTENANLDVTDPEALEETKNLLRGSILRFKDRGKFAGALFRTRPVAFPIGFADATRRRFGAEANGGKTPGRDELRRDGALYAKYLDWWYGKRADFLSACARFLREEGIPDAVVLLDGETSEPGPGLSGGGFVADDPAAVSAAFAANGVKVPDKVVPLKDALAGHRYLKARAEPAGTWGKWEWQHACPADRPLEYGKSHGASLVMPVNRLYSVCDPEAFKAYANLDGVTTMIRHHSLNEHNVSCTVNGKKTSPIGYDMSDTVKAGRASMMVEVNAMANGDPVNIGYLIGSCFASGFPEARREFNGNFLALPATRSRVLKDACDDPEVVVREIDCTKTGHGRYYAIAHVGMKEKHDVKVRLPGKPVSAEFPFYGKSSSLRNGVLFLKTLKPWQLLAIHVHS